MAPAGDGHGPDREALKEEAVEAEGAPAAEEASQRHDGREPEEAAEAHEASTDGASAEGDASGGDAAGEEAVVDAQALQAEVQRLREEISRLTEEFERSQAARQQLQDAYLRLQADFDNFRRRTREQEEQRRLEAAEKVLTDLLPIVDNLERALAAAQAGGVESVAGIRDGVQMILQQMRQVLEKHGVEGAPGVGEVFDPRWHEAVAQEPSPDGGQAEDGPLIVVEEFQKGYRLGRKVLRPSLVKVGTAKGEAAGERAPREGSENSGEQRIADAAVDGDGQ